MCATSVVASCSSARAVGIAAIDDECARNACGLRVNCTAEASARFTPAGDRGLQQAAGEHAELPAMKMPNAMSSDACVALAAAAVAQSAARET